MIKYRIYVPLEHSNFTIYIFKNSPNYIKVVKFLLEFLVKIKLYINEILRILDVDSDLHKSSKS